MLDSGRSFTSRMAREGGLAAVSGIIEGSMYTDCTPVRRFLLRHMHQINVDRRIIAHMAETAMPIGTAIERV